MAKRKKAAGSSYAARSRQAKRAGFRNYAHYRREIQKPAVREILATACVRRGKDRYELAALAANVTTLPGRKGSRKRRQIAGILSDAIRKAGCDPSQFWEAVRSPKRKR